MSSHEIVGRFLSKSNQVTSGHQSLYNSTVRNTVSNNGVYISAGGDTGTKPLTVCNANDVCLLDVDHDGNTSGFHRISAWGNNLTKLYQAVVDLTVGAGDYTSINEALSAGATSIFVRNGIYVVTSDIVLTNRCQIIGESAANVYLSMTNGAQIVCDTNNTCHMTGSLSVDHDSNTVTGVGTSFQTSPALSSGHFISLRNNFFEIDTVVSDTVLTLKVPYRGQSCSGLSYIAQPMLTGVHLKNLIVVRASGTVVSNVHLVGLRHSSVRSVACIGGLVGFVFEKCGDCVMETLISSDNSSHGLDIYDCIDVLLTAVNTYNNNGNGVYIRGVCNNIIMDTCSSTCNACAGFTVADASDVIMLCDCLSKSNHGKGIDATGLTGRVSMSNCSCLWNLVGIDFEGDDNIISNCIIAHNSQHGIHAGNNGVITGCQVNDNGTDGIILNTDQHCIVNNNRCSSNGCCGIKVPDNAKFNSVGNNICRNNGLHGIKVDGIDNVIGSNVCNSNIGHGVNVGISAVNNCITSNMIMNNSGKGIEVLSIDNVIVGNNSSSNSGNNLEVSVGNIKANNRS